MFAQNARPALIIEIGFKVAKQVVKIFSYFLFGSTCGSVTMASFKKKKL